MQSFDFYMTNQYLSWLNSSIFSQGNLSGYLSSCENQHSSFNFQNNILPNYQNQNTLSRVPTVVQNVILQGEAQSECEKPSDNFHDFEEQNQLQRTYAENTVINSSQQQLESTKNKKQKCLTQKRSKLHTDESRQQYVGSRKFSKHSSHWHQQEQHKYLSFVKNNAALFVMSNQEKIRLKINVLMSQKVKSRSPLQCHNHHIRMMKIHRSFQGILQFAERLAEDRKKVYQAKKEHKKMPGNKKDKLNQQQATQNYLPLDD